MSFYCPMHSEEGEPAHYECDRDWRCHVCKRQWHFADGRFFCTGLAVVDGGPPAKFCRKCLPGGLDEVMHSLAPGDGEYCRFCSVDYEGKPFAGVAVDWWS